MAVQSAVCLQNREASGLSSYKAAQGLLCAGHLTGFGVTAASATWIHCFSQQQEVGLNLGQFIQLIKP